MNARNGQKWRYSKEDKDAVVCRLRDYAERFVWNLSSEELWRSAEHVWSSCRDVIDNTHEFDDALLDFGFDFDIEGFRGSARGVSVGNYLYFTTQPVTLRERLNGGDPAVLLRRISWERIELCDELYKLKFL